MRSPIILTAAAALLLAAPAFADRPGADWINVAKVKRMLAAKGYRVSSIEADDGHWEGEAWRRGTKYDFHVDPHSGRITKMEHDRD